MGFSKLRRFIEYFLFQNEIDWDSKRWRTFDAFFFALTTTLRYSIMILMMTMNGWVNLVLALGMMFGYVTFLVDDERKTDIKKS